MTSTLTKGGIALVGVGSVGAGGWAISSYLKSKDDTIKTILKSKGYQLTSELPENKRQDAWDKVSKTYALEVNNDLKIKVGNVTAQEIRDWCLKSIESKNDNSLFQKAKKWCVIYSSFKDKLEEDSFALETDPSSLQSKYSSLGALTDEISKIVPDTGTGNDNGRKLKKWCEKKVYLSYADDSVYQTFKGHCAKSITRTI